MESHIYIIHDGTNAKIGKSNNPDERVKSLQTGNPKALRIAKTYSVPKSKVFAIEKDCHRRLNTSYEKRGEWFRDVDLWDVEIIVESIIEEHVPLTD